MIEHLPNLQLYFEELFRCLKPGGVIRVGGPNGDSAIKKFVEGDSQWFGGFPDKRRSIGGRLENFIFCRQEHLTILTYSYLEELASNAGFESVHLSKPITETNYPDFFDQSVLENEYENTPDCPHTILIEAQKPDVR